MPAKFHGVFGGDDKKHFREIAAFAFHAHLAFAHRFEQGGLRARGGAVDLVGQQDVGENRAFMEMKLLVALVENRHAENVRGQQVGGKLDAFEAGINGAGQGLGQGGLARAGKIFEQDMAAAGEGGEEIAGGSGLPAHNFGNVGRNLAVSFARSVEVVHERNL